jgi:DNA polymerase III sliding clamp (beta) subunit (PCNA family)
LTVTVDRLSLANALKTALPAVGKGVQIPAYQAVRISGGNSRLNVTATDGDLSIISVAEAQLDHADEDGIAVVVAARLVANIVGSMRGDTVNLTVEDGTLRVSSERGTYDLRTLPVEDFPNVVAAEGTSITIDAATKTKLASCTPHPATRPARSSAASASAKVGLPPPTRTGCQLCGSATCPPASSPPGSSTLCANRQGR